MEDEKLKDQNWMMKFSGWNSSSFHLQDVIWKMKSYKMKIGWEMKCEKLKDENHESNRKLQLN